MTSRWRWILLLIAGTTLDLLARFGASFDFARIMHVEAVLFPVIAALLAILLHYEPATQGWPHRIRLGLVWFFALGGLRPVLWSLGSPLMVANVATLGAALAGLLGWTVRRHRISSV